jgi:two-component system, OmpR family, sensor kinase
MLRALSLRARLVLGVIVLAALGLAIADVATYASLRSFLLDRTDSTLESSHPIVEGNLFGRPRDEQGGGPAGRGAPGVDYIEARTLTGHIIESGPAYEFGEETTPPPPKLPAKLDLPKSVDSEGDRVRYFTVSAQSGDLDYRVRAAIERRFPNRILLMATSLSGVESTLHRLLLIELLVTGAVLAALAALGLWVVRLSLRPLAAMEKTAGAIAAGNLTQRVEHADERTEVGRLGLALNAMLARIEAAFKAREASEQKLRRFVADASHELRTPLAAVRAYAELFRRGADQNPDDLARSMDGITREAERMSKLVEETCSCLPASTRDAPSNASPSSSTRSSARQSRPHTRSTHRGRSHSRRSRRSCSATTTGCARSWTTCSATSARTRRPTRPSTSPSAATTARP